MTYTREQFETMAPTDVVCPRRTCEALTGAPCTIGRRTTPRGSPHLSRLKFYRRVRDAGLTFFDVMAAEKHKRESR